MGIPILGDILGVVGDVVNRLIPDKGKAAEMKHEIAMSLMTTDLAQMEINKAEATHKSTFVAGWRPAVGWVCVASLAYTYILAPLGNTYLAIKYPDVVLPKLDTTELMTLLFGLLGMGTLRSYDKAQGTSTNFIKEIIKK